MDPMSKQSASITSLSNASTQMLSWIFPAGRTDPVLHLAYWHARLLSELISPDRRQRPINILQATKNIIEILAANHDLLSPITHHFGTLAALGLAELQRFQETRDEAAKLTKDVLDYSIAPSPWNAALRVKLAEQQQQHQQQQARPDTASSVAGGGDATSQNLQQLADLATAADGSAAAAEGGLKEGMTTEAGNGVAANNGVVSAAEASAKPEDAPSRAEVDVRAVLMGGYLNWFEEEAEDEVLV